MDAVSSGPDRLSMTLGETILRVETAAIAAAAVVAALAPMSGRDPTDRIGIRT